MSTSRKDECEIWNTCSTTEECRNTPGNFTCTQYTDVLVFKKMKAGLVNFFDKTWIDLEINFEDKTDSHWSCGILFKNVQFVFGGQNEIRQVSKVREMFYRSATDQIDDCALRRVGDLDFAFGTGGACHSYQNQLVFLCFGVDNFNQCRVSRSPGGFTSRADFNLTTNALYNHHLTEISSSEEG